MPDGNGEGTDDDGDMGFEGGGQENESPSEDVDVAGLSMKLPDGVQLLKSNMDGKSKSLATLEDAECVEPLVVDLSVF